MRHKPLRMGLILILVLVAGFVGFAWTVLSPHVGSSAAIKPTADGDAKPLWRFGFVGDTHHGMHDDVAGRILERLAASECEFVLHLGDQVDEGDSEEQWRSWIALARQHRVRLLPAVGNHDAISEYRDRGEIAMRRRFPYLPETFYHFQHRGLNFLMLNSEHSLMPVTRQRHFLSAQLQAHPGTTLLCIHRPVFTCSDRDWANKYLRQLWLHSAVLQSDVALVLSGHNHYYERTHPLDEIVYVTSGGGTANVYGAPVANSHTAKLVAGRPHYGQVDVFDDRFVASILDLKGATLDQFQIVLRPPHHEPGHQLNRTAIELPPIATLPRFQADATDTADAPDDQMPRPW